MAQWVKDPVLLMQWSRSLLWLGFNPRPGNFCMLQVHPKKRKREKELIGQSFKKKKKKGCIEQGAEMARN